MEKMGLGVAIPLNIGNTNIPITTRLKLITDTSATLFGDTAEAGCSCGDLAEIEVTDQQGDPGFFSNWVGSRGEVVVREREDEDLFTVGSEQVVDCSCSLTVASDTTSLCGGQFLGMDGGLEVSTLITVDIDESLGSVTLISCEDVMINPTVDLLDGPNVLDELDPKTLLVLDKLPKERKIVGWPNVLEMDCLPLWGCISTCGRRSEMEDTMAAIPRFSKIPIQMFTSDNVVDKMNQSLSHLTAHFFGVYDGHGGAQVANYCRERIHTALIEEIETIKEGGSLEGDGCEDTWQVKWEKIFISCFLKVDAEVGGTASRANIDTSPDGFEKILEPVASETVGSTAVVTIVCSSLIIVANCGDSRAVLCRGKEAMALSVDHKPNREDEYERIEAAGGRIIQWNGYRVFGVLAMSRSIGDRYLKPCIIPEPEIMIVPRMKEDECLILASDGLWDVMTNEEVCDVARRRILLWHKKNGSNVASATERGGVDSAAQAAADYLSKLALQKGSEDNITIIVVDLKTRRKFKSKT